MTVLSAITAACLKIGVERPSAVFGQSTRTAYELQAAANEAAKMIAFDTGHDWTRLKTLGSFTGDGASLGFDLPADYRRMLKRAHLWPSDTPYAPYTWYSDTDEWLAAQVQALVPFIGAWTIIGDQVQIRVGGATSPLGNGDTVQFYYVTDLIVLDSNGSAIDAFAADTDTFKLDERLLTLAIVYKWKQDKGQDYAEALSDYENLLFERVGSDKGQSIISVGRPRVPANVGLAYPRALGS